jgi:hypothetical protein
MLKLLLGGGAFCSDSSSHSDSVMGGACCSCPPTTERFVKTPREFRVGRRAAALTCRIVACWGTILAVRSFCCSVRGDCTTGGNLSKFTFFYWRGDVIADVPLTPPWLNGELGCISFCISDKVAGASPAVGTRRAFGESGSLKKPSKTALLI